MLLKEAKEILKKNGYRLIEAYAEQNNDDTYDIDLDSDIPAKYNARVKYDTEDSTIIEMIMNYCKEVKHQSDKFINYWSNMISRISHPGGYGQSGKGYLMFKKIKKSEKELAREESESGSVWSTTWSFPDYKLEGDTFAELGEQFLKYVKNQTELVRRHDDEDERYGDFVALNEAKEILAKNGYLLENCLDELTEFGKKRFYRLCRLYKQAFMLETEDEAYDILSRTQNLHTYLNDKTVSLDDIIDKLNNMDL